MKKDDDARTRAELSFRMIASDIHFWIPLLVLLAGLFVLHTLY